MSDDDGVAEYEVAHGVLRVDEKTKTSRLVLRDGLLPFRPMALKGKYRG